MTTLKTLFASGLFLGVTLLSAPSAEAQKGKSNKAEKQQIKAERKVVKQEQKSIRKTQKNYQKTVASRRSTSTQGRVLCANGTWVTRAVNACWNRGGYASRNGTYFSTPRASDRARERAALNSAVRRNSYANLTRTNAIARCMDGTYWHSTTRSGACYRHGGVARWY